ncbi:MAG: TGS domain-containing protein [Caldisericia bacterium]|jgi:ribosome-interacting GTPase 1|nr:TGS domain-containing protein [Caldisericia bacterium]
MPANLPPQFYELEREYREKKTIQEKIEILKKMYAIMPKHKGTDKLQAEIKAKISKLKEELEYQRKNKGKRSSFYIEREGAGQVTLVGPPNSGKSTLFYLLSSVPSEIGDYPFTTKTPVVGMVPFEDIKIQFIDLPPIDQDSDYTIFDIIRNSDLILIVLSFEMNLNEELDKILKILSDKGIKILGEGLSEDHLFGPLNKRGLIFINKSDLLTQDEIDNILKNLNTSIPITFGSCESIINIEVVMKKIFEGLNIIRVYTKEPGKPPDMTDPLILKKGSTVLDAAYKLHKEIAKNLKYARLWGSSRFEGQQVNRDYILQDKDIVEFHTK